VKFLDPETVRVRSGLPTMALLGEIEMFADRVLEGFELVRLAPPQANCHMIRNPTAIHEKRLGMTSSTLGDVGSGSDSGTPTNWNESRARGCVPF